MERGLEDNPGDSRAGRHAPRERAVRPIGDNEDVPLLQPVRDHVDAAAKGEPRPPSEVMLAGLRESERWPAGLAGVIGLLSFVLVILGLVQIIVATSTGERLVGVALIALSSILGLGAVVRRIRGG